MEIPEEVLDGIREFVTIGVGYSAGILNDLTNKHVTLTVPEVDIIDVISENIIKSPQFAFSPENTSEVVLSFSGECTGSLSLIIPYKSAINLVALLTGEEGTPDDMDALRVETLLEVGNIITSSVMSSFSVLLTSRLNFLFPRYKSGTWDLEKPLGEIKPDIGIIAKGSFILEGKEIEALLLFLLTKKSFDQFDKKIREIMENGL